MMLPKLRCSVASECGGCSTISLAPEEQRSRKLKVVHQLVTDTLSKSDRRVLISFDPCAATAGYRNRIRLKISERAQITFFNERKDRLCPVLAPELRISLENLLRLSLECSTSLQRFSHLELRAPDLDGQASLYFSYRVGIAPHPRCERSLNQLFSGEFVLGFNPGVRPTQRYPLGSELYQRVALGSFMQVNFHVNYALVSAVVAGALARSVRSAADLYCGSGNFLLPLLDAGISGLGVEKDPLALEGARQAAREQGLGGRWICEDVASWSKAESRTQSRNFDLLVLDPPRAGLGLDVDWIRAIAPRYLALCSCSSAGLKDDISRLSSLGFAVTEVLLFDMFEHTDQVEVLTWFSLADHDCIALTR